MPSTGVSIEGLSFRYPDYPGMPSRRILRGADLAVEPGTLAALLGESDGGKTTMARILGALVPRFTGGALEGRVSAAGVDVTAARPFDLVERVGLVFQNPDEQIVTTRCDAEVAFALESLGTGRDEMQRRVRSALELTGLSGFAARNPASLSGGEKKRLLLACLAAVDPAVWVLDEAFEELDARWREAVVGHLRATGRTAVVTASRWSPLLEQAVDSCTVIADGTLRSWGRDRRGELLAALADGGLSQPAGRGPAAGCGEPALRAEGLRYRFPTGDFTLAVDSLELRRGEVCALVGANGSGKSTLARILCGLLQPDAGTVSLNRGAGMRATGSAELNAGVGYLFQNPDYQIYLPTIAEELAVGLAARGIRGAAAGARIQEAVGRFGLPDPATPPALMSYGSRKLLQAATFWLLERDVVILDESDAGLSVRQFLRLLQAVATPEVAVLLITHDPGLVRGAAGRALVMERGAIARALDGADLEEPPGAAGGRS